MRNKSIDDDIIPDIDIPWDAILEVYHSLSGDIKTTYKNMMRTKAQEDSVFSNFLKQNGMKF